MRAGGAAVRTLAVAWVLVLGACGDDDAVGGPERIVVAARPAILERVGGRLREVLEPTIFPLPGERAFELVPVDPGAATWEEERRGRQVLLIGAPEDPWIADALERRPGAPPVVPSVRELADVWAERQHVLVLLIAPDDPEAALEETIADVRTAYDRRYREYVVERMYFPEGPDQSVADTLQQAGGFDLLVPVAYEWSREGDVFFFRPPDTDTTTLRRRIAVTWQTPMPDAVQSGPRALFEWRERLSAEHYGARQRVAPTGMRGGPTTHRGSFALHLIGTWTAGEERGPFLLRAVMCPAQDRMYLLDGWLHAPGQDGQEYMVQLESILNSFRCGSARR